MEKSPDPELIYVLRPNYVKDGVRYTEAHGILRSTNVSINKPANVFRIAVIGDSIAAELGRRQQQKGTLPFPDQLEALMRNPLKQTGINVEVLNFGTDGYGTLQEARLLETRVQQFSPDLIILAFCFNDIGNSLTPTIFFMDNKPPPSFLYSFVVELMGRSLPAAPLDPHPTQFVPRIGPITSEPNVVAYWRNLYTPGSPGWKRLKDGFSRIAAVTNRLGAPVIVLLFPLLTGNEGDFEILQAMHVMMVSEVRARGFYLVDLTDPFSRIPIEVIRENHPWDHYHPSPTGHAIAAQALSAFILKNFASPQQFPFCNEN